jgi:HK97 family phage major capsid protein
MDQLARAAIQRAHAALATIGREDDVDGRLLDWERVKRIQIVARDERRRNGEADIAEIAERLYGADRDTRPVVEIVKHMTKGAVGSGETASGSWGAELYSPAKLDTAVGVAARRASVLGRLAAQRVPFDLPIGAVSASASLGWVAESGSIPAKLLTTARLPALKHAKLAGISTFSIELAQASDLEGVLVRDVVRSLTDSMDLQLLDPAVTAIGELPGSLVNTLTPISGGSLTTPGALDAKLLTAIGELVTAGSDLIDCIWVTTPTVAAAIAALRDTSGAVAYPGLGTLGGVLLGLPLLTARAAPASQIALLDGGEVLYATDDGVEVSLSREALVESDSAGSGTRESMFGTNSVAIKIVQSVNWHWRRVRASVITSATIG